MDVTIPPERRTTPNVIALLAAAAIGAGATAGAYQAFGARPGAEPGTPSAPATIEPTSVAGSAPARIAPTTVGDDGCVTVSRMRAC
jgi:hypothetical protein